MKRFIIGLCVLFLLVMPMAAYAQDGGGDDDEPTPDDLIEYGASLTGEITNSKFEDVYLFAAEDGDVIVISMTRTNDNDGLDPYLYLTTEDNELLAQNDDANSVNARIVYRIQEAGTYQIVATRLGDRTGSSVGEYVLDLEKPQVSGTDVVMEGTLASRYDSNFHVYIPEEEGVYTITYRHISGNYYPNFVAQSLVEESYYYEEIGIITSRQLQGGSLTIELSPDSIYIFSTQENYYDYEDVNHRAVYTIEVTLAE